MIPAFGTAVHSSFDRDFAGVIGVGDVGVSCRVGLKGVGLAGDGVLLVVVVMAVAVMLLMEVRGG